MTGDTLTTGAEVSTEGPYRAGGAYRKAVDGTDGKMAWRGNR
jgi:hypothetical protein